MLRNSCLFLLLALFGWVGLALAQDDAALSLSLSRDVGAGFGNQIQGMFSFRVTGPANLERVVFLIDDQEMAKIQKHPFVYSLEQTTIPQVCIH
jgi:hypothetical protein